MFFIFLTYFTLYNGLQFYKRSSNSSSYKLKALSVGVVFHNKTKKHNWWKGMSLGSLRFQKRKQESVGSRQATENLTQLGLQSGVSC